MQTEVEYYNNTTQFQNFHENNNNIHVEQQQNNQQEDNLSQFHFSEKDNQEQFFIPEDNEFEREKKLQEIEDELLEKCLLKQQQSNFDQNPIDFNDNDNENSFMYAPNSLENVDFQQEEEEQQQEQQQEESEIYMEVPDFGNDDENKQQQESSSLVINQSMTTTTIISAEIKQNFNIKPAPISKKSNKINKNSTTSKKKPPSKKKQQRDYDKNICRYLARQVIRSCMEQCYKQKVQEICFSISQENNNNLYNSVKQFLLSKIEFITGHRAFRDMLLIQENEKQTEMYQVKKAFQAFAIWFLKNRASRYIMNGAMTNKQQYIKFKNQIMLPNIKKPENWESNICKSSSKKKIVKPIIFKL